MIPAIFTQDWYNRSDEFVSNNGANSIINVNCNETYCTFLYTDARINEIMTDKKQLKYELMSIMAAIGIEDVRLIFEDNDIHACTTGDYIEIGINFGKTNLSLANQLDIIIGLLLHECCHCLYTDFKYCHSAMGKYPNLVHHIHNIIEDELIEQRLGLAFPGYMNFLKKVKYYFWEKKEKIVDKDDFQTILNMLLYIVRYPKYIYTVKESKLVKFESLFNDINKIFKNTDCFVLDSTYTSLNSTACAIQTYERIISFLKDNGYNIPEEDFDISMFFDLFNSLMMDCDSSSESLTPEQAAKVHSTVERAAKDEDPEFKISGGENESVSYADSYLRNKAIYNGYFREVNPFVNGLTKLLKPNKYLKTYKVNHFTKNGTLDASRLANGFCGEKFIYKQIQEKVKKIDTKYAILVMIDESGSMRGGKINILASKLAVLFYEGFSKMKGNEIYIYGHGDVVYKYIDKTTRDKFVLGARNSQGGQNENKSYKIIVEEVRKQTNLPIVAFNITDSCYLSGSDTIKETIDEFKKDNVFINLICISHNNRNNNEDENNDKIYGKGNWICYSTPPSGRVDYKYIITELARIIRTTIQF